MKTPKPKLILLAAGLAAFVPSCVDPYYGGAVTTSATVTHYQPGYVVHTLPPRYETVVISGTPYYRYNDVYYRPQGNRYVVVHPPYDDRRWGYRDRDRWSRGYERNDGRYDRDDDGRYDRDDDRGYDRDQRPDRPYDRDERWTGNDRGRTTVIRTLPRGTEVVVHRGARYYRSGDTYYQERGEGYVVVEQPR